MTRLRILGKITQSLRESGQVLCDICKSGVKDHERRRKEKHIPHPCADAAGAAAAGGGIRCRRRNKRSGHQYRQRNGVHEGRRCGDRRRGGRAARGVRKAFPAAGRGLHAGGVRDGSALPDGGRVLGGDRQHAAENRSAVCCPGGRHDAEICRVARQRLPVRDGVSRAERVDVAGAAQQPRRCGGRAGRSSSGGNGSPRRNSGIGDCRPAAGGGADGGRPDAGARGSRGGDGCAAAGDGRGAAAAGRRGVYAGHVHGGGQDGKPGGQNAHLQQAGGERQDPAAENPLQRCVRQRDGRRQPAVPELWI